MVEQQKRGRGRPRTGFDKKRYDRERIARIRDEAKLLTIPKP